MTITITGRAQGPYGGLAPDGRGNYGFTALGEYWTSVEQFMLADRLARPEDRKVVRREFDPAKARALAASFPERQGWREEFAGTLEQAVRASFEADLRRRALLLSTGDEPIEVRVEDPRYGEGNLLGRILLALRAEYRRRLDDPSALQCHHAAAAGTGALCVHLLSGYPEPWRYHRRFTGQGARYELVCPACAAALPAPPPVRHVCASCFERERTAGREADLGAPELRERASGIRFEHRVVRLPGLPVSSLTALVPIPRAPGVWLALDRTGQLHRVEPSAGRLQPGARLPAEALDLSAPLSLHVAPSGQLAAVAEVCGRRAVVLAPLTGEITQRIQRDDYHPDVTPFPLAFFEHAGALRLAHGSEWNRLDVSDPFTGRLLTARPSPRYEHGREPPPHYLDYFHASLLPSPSGERVLDNGWVWQPSAVPRTFSLRRWLDENVWESEDGPSAHDLCVRESWPAPACWLAEPLVALWGAGDDDWELTPAARVFDADTGVEVRSFAGPAENLFFDAPYLVACGEGGGSVWDIETGERLAVDPLLRPVGHHPASGELVSYAGDDFRVSRRSS